MVRTIRLARGVWTFDDASRIGQPGGFGSVYLGASEAGEVAAIKMLNLQAPELAHRELRIADDLAGRNLQHVMPVLDAGQDADSDDYFVVMPVAEGSLQDHLDAGERFSGPGLAEVLLDIAEGLAEVPDITHRDLKPANVLLHQGMWKIADFGIARFVEDTTSLHTLKGFLSRPYAAPEQWREERATGATDIYALGCVAHALVRGSPPFPGPAPEDFKRQHLEQPPPALEGEPSHLRSLVSQMLRKNQALRPNVGRVISQLRTIHESRTAPEGVAALAAAGALIAEKEGREEAERSSRAATEATRRSIAGEGISSLHEVAAGLLSRIQEEAPSAKRSGDMAVSLGAGTLAISVGRDYMKAGVFDRSGWDVLAGGRITLKQEGTTYRGRSASLWFTDLGQGETVRWYEVPYMRVFSHEERWDYPFALDEVSDADLAASNVTHAYQHAANPTPIEDEDFDSFCERWMERLALAAEGRLTTPGTLPE